MQTEVVADLIKDVCERVILPRFRTLERHQVEQKRPGDVVTIADREAEAELTAAFQAATPGALIVGEEASFADPTSLRALPDVERAWVIDPVDGTRNFASGSVDFGVMVAEVRRGETTRGWIWQPLHDSLYVVERGAGVSLNGRPLAHFASGSAPWQVAVWPKLTKLSLSELALRPTRGSCAIDYPAVARGELHGLAYRSIHPWDHLAGALMVTELGGAAVVGNRTYRPGVTGPLLAIGASDAVAAAIGAGLSG